MQGGEEAERQGGRFFISASLLHCLSAYFGRFAIYAVFALMK